MRATDQGDVVRERWNLLLIFVAHAVAAAKATNHTGDGDHGTRAGGGSGKVLLIAVGPGTAKLVE